MRKTVTFAALFALAGSTARAEAIMPWSGASAGVHVFDPLYPSTVTTPKIGAVASDSDSKVNDVTYLGSRAQSQRLTFSVPVSGSAKAEATGQATGLLKVDAQYSAPNPGTTPTITSGSALGVAAKAGWTDDSVRLRAADGASLPSTVRLNFRLEFRGSGSPDYTYTGGDGSGITITANGQAASVSGANNVYGKTYEFQPSTLKFDSTSSPSFSPYGVGAGIYNATFHVDLPVSAEGISDPFSLSLAANTTSGLASNNTVVSSLSDVNLSLTSVTTTDGTLLSDLGDRVTFTSGMLAPGAQASPIPEPSSIAVVGGLIAAVGLRSLLRRRRPAVS